MPNATFIVDLVTGNFHGPFHQRPTGREIMVQKIIAWSGLMNVARPGFLLYTPAGTTSHRIIHDLSVWKSILSREGGR